MWSSFTTKKDKKGKKGKAITEEPVKVSVHLLLPFTHTSSSYLREIRLGEEHLALVVTRRTTILILSIGRGERKGTRTRGREG